MSPRIISDATVRGSTAASSGSCSSKSGHKVQGTRCVKPPKDQKWSCPGKPTRVFWGPWWRAVEANYTMLSLSIRALLLFLTLQVLHQLVPVLPSHMYASIHEVCQSVCWDDISHRCHHSGFNAGWKTPTWSHHRLSRGFYVFVNNVEAFQKFYQTLL